jgi:TonB family protein
MSRRIKLHTFHFLFRLFAYLADKSGGWRVFVRPKLLLGSLIVGLGLTACGTKTENISNQKIKDSTRTAERNKKISLERKNNKSSKTTMCYSPIAAKKEEPMKLKEPLITCYDTEVIERDTVAVDSNYIYQVVDRMPQFSKGSDSLSTYVSKNLKWPNTDADVQGKVILRFVVNTNGSISDIEIIRSLHPVFDAEAIRVIKTLPNFIPGKLNGKVVRAYYVIPIIFRTE